MDESQFYNSDSWIFLAIASNQNDSGVSLEDVISRADCINHAIPTNEEIEGAINRFLKFGIIEIKNNKFYLTDFLKEDYEKINKKTRYLLKQWDLINELFQNRKFKEKNFDRFFLNPDESKKAYESYSKKFWKTYEEIEKEEKREKK